jgi:hypothetical protein
MKRMLRRVLAAVGGFLVGYWVGLLALLAVDVLTAGAVTESRYWDPIVPVVMLACGIGGSVDLLRRNERFMVQQEAGRAF